MSDNQLWVRERVDRGTVKGFGEPDFIDRKATPADLLAAVRQLDGVVDYEAAAQKVYALYHWGNHPPYLNDDFLNLAREEARAIIDAALAARLLVPTSEEEK